MSTAPIVIIGTGIAGYTVARELRKLDKQTAIHMFTTDDGHFYSKPMLSNGFSAGKTESSLCSFSVEQMRAQLQAEIHTNTIVQAVDTVAHEITVDGKQVPYSKLVLAMGASPVRLALGGDAADKVLSVNNLRDYAVLHAQLSTPRQIAIIGGGLIGCEFANDLSKAGHKVSLIDPASTLLSRLTPYPVGERLAHALQAVGVQLLCGLSCKDIYTDAKGLQIHLSNSQILAADLVISAVGLRPNIDLAKMAGIETLEGIVTDAYLQTSAKNVYALGDCAQVAGLVLPYVMPTVQCARALANTLAGQATPVHYAAMPIVVKTPAMPLAIAPPLHHEGTWHEQESTADGFTYLHHDAEGRHTGFIVGGKSFTLHRQMANTLPPWLAPTGSPTLKPKQN